MAPGRDAEKLIAVIPQKQGVACAGFVLNEIGSRNVSIEDLVPLLRSGESSRIVGVPKHLKRHQVMDH